MPKAMPLNDFRAVRIVLEPDDFAWGPAEDPPPSDLIDKDTWQGLVGLPDDVLIRTTNYRGSLVKIMYDLQSSWITTVGDEIDPLYNAILDASDEFQVTIFNAACGYYRTAIGSLRYALEHIALGTYYQVCGTPDEYSDWRAGKAKMELGPACDRLIRADYAPTLSTHIRKDLGDGLFGQKSGSKPGGWARRLYSELSDYSHSRPGFSQADKWASNGPVYVPQVLGYCFDKFLETSGLCFSLVKLGRPDFVLPGEGHGVFKSSRLKSLEVAQLVYQHLFNEGQD